MEMSLGPIIHSTTGTKRTSSLELMVTVTVRTVLWTLTCINNY
jgi:hypothetical protein